MKVRKLRDLEVSAIGYGCMGLSMGYGATPSKEEAIALIRNAYDQGCTFFDTAAMYAMGANEELVGEALKGIREKVVIATKVLFQKDWEGDSRKHLMQVLRGHLENSLKNLGINCIDLYYQHRVNKDIPVEDFAWCMGEFIKEGKIGGWGQSQATAEEIRRAHAVTPLTAIQSHYSIMAREFEADVLPVCKELRIGFVAFSPLEGGLLTGKIKADANYIGFDARRVAPRFEKENIEANQPLIDLLQHFANEKNATPAQITLAWMMHKYDFIVPIPGGRSKERMAENFGAANVNFSGAEFEKLEEGLSKIKIHGRESTEEDMGNLWVMVQNEMESK